MKKLVIDARESGTSTGRYVDKLIEHLYELKSPYRVTVLTTSQRLEFMCKLVPRFEVIESRYKEFTFAEQIGLLRQLQKIKPDLVHFPMIQQPILYQGHVVTTMQDLTTVRFRNPSKNWLVFTLKQQVYKFVTYWAAHKSARVMTPSEYVKADVARYTRINSRKVTVTLEAADAISDPPEPITELEDKHFIMYVGRPQPHKNLERLIEAFAIMRQTNPDLYLVLAGKRDVLYRRLRKRTELLGIKHVLFTGFVSEGQLRWMYEHTAAYIFPSLSEGFGLPGLEAMMHSAPVVSSDATCLPEIYKDAAVYFNPLDVAEIASTISNVLVDVHLRKHLVARGKAVAGSYSWRRTAQQTLDVYKEVLGD